MSALPRRLRSFSLRTLMVLVGVSGVFCGWLAYERQTAVARRSLRNRLWAEYQVSFRAAEHASNPPYTKSVATIPSVRRWFGDEPIHTVHCWGRVGPDTVDDVRRLFPEALVTNQRDPTTP
ncbi:MAG: hypothetical protein U0836_22735 [Pirellulales bacterium]